MPGRVSDNRSPSPLRREVREDSYQGVTSSECVQRDGSCAWNQNFTNAGNEGNQNANNKENTNNSVRSARRLSLPDTNLTVEEVLVAYQDCRKHKRNNETTIDFELNLPANIMRIYREVTAMTWRPSGHMCFVVKSPKIREVWASPFADRIVHHIIYNRLRPRFEPQFIATSFACIPNRGTSGASDWAMRAARKVTQGWSKKAYVLQADIANFFPSICTQRLCDKLLSKCPEPWLRHLVKEIIMVDVQRNAHFPGDPNLLNLIPPHKSLWHTPPGIGMPIGNLTSQFGANVDMDEIDQDMVRSKHARHYGRYVDDIVMLDQSKGKLEQAKQTLANHLGSLGLSLNMDKTEIRPLEHGFDFCGRFVKPWRTYLRRATVRRGKAAMGLLRRSAHPAETVTSYMALARHCNAYNLRRKWASLASKSGLMTDSEYTKAFIGETP